MEGGVWEEVLEGQSSFLNLDSVLLTIVVFQRGYLI